MEHYDLEVLDHGVRVVVAHGVELPDSQAIWRRIHSIAQRINKPGLMIRVTNSTGRIIILVGVATALRLFAGASGVLPPM